MPAILTRSLLALSLAALFSACGSSDDTTGGESSNLTADCQKVCTAIKPLMCPKEPSDCAAGCQQMLAQLPKCKTQVEAFVKCSATHPTADWECDSDGEASLKMGCDNEAIAVLGCATSGK